MQLSDEQLVAINSANDNCLLLAGPGTGKSYTILGLIKKLIDEEEVSAHNILVITFTRAATHELKLKIENILGTGAETPHVYTLHAFALRQLMKNRSILGQLPISFSIVDDYEERNYIMEDIKRQLSGSNIRTVRDLFNKLSSNWETLNADRSGWESSFDSPEFLGAWLEHREIFGYVLRSELVYQFKKALEETPDIQIDGPITHLIVDEYQDLNKCDLRVIHELVRRGANIFAAGDDDQSIYGFRYAFPEGIREFSNDVPNSQQHEITECHRCDKDILILSINIITQDHRRIPKSICSVSGQTGTVGLLRFENQDQEAVKIADLIKTLKNDKNYDYSDFLVLLRSDRHRVFSSVLVNVFEDYDIRINQSQKKYELLDRDETRKLVGIGKFLISNSNDLAIRTILSCTKGIGTKTIDSMIDLCRGDNCRFNELIAKLVIGEYPEFKNRKLIMTVLAPVLMLRQQYIDEVLEFDEIIDRALDIVKPDTDPDEFCASVRNFLANENIDSLDSLMALTTDIINKAESADEHEDGVRIMTMHQAKGLTSKVVFVVGVEDEYIPGGGDVAEERRLLYVSLTRAKHYLFLTYSNKRTGRQSHTGKRSSTSRRTLSRFLSNLPEPRPVNGISFSI